MSVPKRYKFIGEDNRFLKNVKYTLSEVARTADLHEKTIVSRMQFKCDKVITDNDIRPTTCNFFGGRNRASIPISKPVKPPERLSSKWLKRKLVVSDI